VDKDMFVGREEGSICVSVCAAGVSAVWGMGYVIYSVCVCVVCMCVGGDGYKYGSLPKADKELSPSALPPLFPASAWPTQTCLVDHQTVSQGCRVTFLGGEEEREGGEGKEE